eukprot:4980879-Pleurochrysis_carterae.AAC.2
MSRVRPSPSCNQSQLRHGVQSPRTLACSKYGMPIGNLLLFPQASSLLSAFTSFCSCPLRTSYYDTRVVCSVHNTRYKRISPTYVQAMTVT